MRMNSIWISILVMIVFDWIRGHQIYGNGAVNDSGGGRNTVGCLGNKNVVAAVGVSLPFKAMTATSSTDDDRRMLKFRNVSGMNPSHRGSNIHDVFFSFSRHTTNFQ